MVLFNRVAPDGSIPRRRARSAPTVLAVLLILAMEPGPARAVWPFDRLFPKPALAQRAATLLSDAIQIPTVNPPGDEARLARRFTALLERAGIENKLIATPSPNGGPDRAAVWGRLRGSGDQPGLALLSHLDTVPAKAADWSVDPFAGRVWDGFVWGRGALDAKGVAVTHLLALLELADSGEPPSRDIVFLSTPDEETGGLLGAGWITKQHPELLEGIGFLLTEGGGIRAAPSLDSDRPEVWGITLTEKAPCWLELRARGLAGHSAAPTKDAAVPRLIAALDRIRRIESPVQVVDEVAAMFAKLAPLAAEWDRAGFQNLARGLETDDAFRRRFLDNPGQNSLVRNTVSITVLEAAPRTNVAPAMARAQLDARLLPGENCKGFAQAIASLIDEPSIEVIEILSFPARASSSQTPLYRAIEQVPARQASDVVVVPRMIAGFTDAHWFRELGIVAYGFVPRALSREESRRVHGIDERIAIDTLVRSIELTVEIVRSLDSIDSPGAAIFE